jgi:hypothetical protein
VTYATLDDVKVALGISDYQDDARIEVALQSAEEMVNAYCERTFDVAGTAATTRVYAASDYGYLSIDDCTAVTLVESDFAGTGTWTAWATTDWQAEPLNGRQGGRSVPYTGLRSVGNYSFPESVEALVRVTATWGWAVTPQSIATATRLQAARLFKRSDSPLGVAGFGDMGAMRVSRYMDPDVELLLAPYRRGGVGGIA